MSDLGLPTTATVLFTDLVGSTAARTRLGEDAAEVQRRTHDQLLATVVENHRGRVVKGTGDGILATFTAASDGVAAAVAIQQAADVHRRTHRASGFQLRVGLSVGDVTFDGGDVYGTPVVEASRLCDVAGPDEILATAVIEHLARGRGGHQFQAAGAFDLKGLAGPLDAVRIGWDPLGTSDLADGIGFPASLLSSQALPFAGREDALEQLSQAWKSVADGDCRIVLIAGEPGVGKTRLSGEFAQRALDDGAAVVYGHCDESLDVAFQPFVEILENIARRLGPAEAAERLGPCIATLSRLVPALGDGGAGPPEAGDPESERYRVLTAIGDAIGAIGRISGVVVLLDDLHWADRATIEAVRLLARSPRPGVLVVGTYRDTEVDISHPWGQTLADLRREPVVERLALRGLDVAAVADLMRAAAEDATYDDRALGELAEAIATETSGNAFFVGEVLRHLVDSGALLNDDGTWRLTRPLTEVGIPEGVRDVVTRRVGALGSATQSVLVGASVIGQRFQLSLLSTVTELPEVQVVDALQEALDAQIVEELEVGGYRFLHALARDTIYEGLSATRRMLRHLVVAEALERAGGTDVEALSYHWAQASRSNDTAIRAADYGVEAGDRAMAARAPDTAMDAYRHALALADDAGRDDPTWRIDVLTKLGNAQRTAGNIAYQATLYDATRAALDLGDAERAGVALLETYRGLSALVLQVDDTKLDLIDQVLSATALSPELRARLLSLRATELLYHPDLEERARAADAALAAAEGLGPAVEAEAVLGAIEAMSSPHTWDRFTALNARLNELFDFLPPRIRNLQRSGAVGRFVVLGQVHEARALLEETLEYAEEHREPMLLALAHTARVNMLMVDGRLAEAEVANDEFLAYALATEEPDLPMWHQASLLGIRWQQGRMAEMTSVCEVAVDLFPDSPSYRAVLAFCRVETGEDASAAELLDGVANRLNDPAADPTLAVTLVCAGIVAARLQSSHRERMLGLLTDIAGIVPGAGALTIDLPPMAAGQIHRSLGHLDTAIQHFELAVARSEEIGARGFRARAQAQLAATLHQRGRPADGSRASVLAADAAATARELGTGDVLDVVADLLA